MCGGAKAPAYAAISVTYSLQTSWCVPRERKHHTEEKEGAKRIVRNMPGTITSYGMAMCEGAEAPAHAVSTRKLHERRRDTHTDIKHGEMVTLTQ